MIEINPGQLQIHAINAINTSAGIEDAALVADRMNSAGFIRAEFIESQSILYSNDLASGSVVTIKEPSGKYATQGALLVSATGPELFKMELTDQVPTKSIYDLPQDAQVSYWATIIMGLHGFASFAKSHPDGDHLKPFATENCIVTRTKEGIRTSRSIAIPHAHINLHDQRDVLPFENERFDDPVLEQNRRKPLEDTTPHLVLEQKLLQRQRLVTGFVRRIQTHVEQTTGQTLNGLRLRTERPYGYTFTPSSNNNIQETAQMMRAHHKAYAENAQRLYEKFKDNDELNIIPQPSYRLLMCLDKNGIFSATISPEALSYSGALEVMGLELKRGTEYPPGDKNAIDRANSYAINRIRQELRLMRPQIQEPEETELVA